MTVLSVNMNVAALLRNRRNHPWPDVLALGRMVLEEGAGGLTVHPRPDERHTKSQDVWDLSELIGTEFPDRELNVEGYPDDRFLNLVSRVGPTQVTLVPDDPSQATSDHGWDFQEHQDVLSRHVQFLKTKGCRVALFCDPNEASVRDAARTGADRVELYTGPYGAKHSDVAAEKIELEKLSVATQAAHECGLGVNAGHDLTVPGTTKLLRSVQGIDEVSIGHALFCDALSFGMRKTVSRYLLACVPNGT